MSARMNQSEIIANRTQARSLGCVQHATKDINQALIFGFLASCYYAGQVEVPPRDIIAYMRQTPANVSRYLRMMTAEGTLKSRGQTRNAAYRISGM